MKTALCSSLALFALFAAVPAGCSYTTSVDVANDFCAQLGTDRYEYLPVGLTADGTQNMGSFEPATFKTPTDALIVDDDDLIDDYPVWVEAVKIARASFAEHQAELAVYAAIPPELEEADYTAEQQAAVAYVDDLVSQLSPMCGRLPEAFIAPEPGDDISYGYWPTFTACKDKYNANGDGVIGLFDLMREGRAPQDEKLAACPSLSGGANTSALNVWGPLSTTPSDIPGLPANAFDGFTYSGITVPMTIATYRQTEDKSMWEGIAFWARQADSSEAIAIGPSPAGKEPYNGRPIPANARPQDGVGQLGVIIQTMDTAAVLDPRGGIDGLGFVSVCGDGQVSGEPAGTFCFATQEEYDAFPGYEMPADPATPDATPTKRAYIDANGQPQTPEVPYCIDYSPVDTLPGEEAPFRDQCWDGFRTMIEVTQDWKFYRVPFANMRQAGWGRVAKSFRTDQIRSVNFLGSAYQPMNVMIDEVVYYRQIPSKPAVVETAPLP